MKNPIEESQIPPAMLEKLNEVRARDRSITLRTGLLRSFAILIAAMLLAMVIDWLVVLHDTRWRWTVTLLALGCAVAALIQGCLLPLMRRRSLASIAREVDRAHPSLEERYLTLAEFGRAGEDATVCGSASMLQQVAQEATAMTGGIVADSVVPKFNLIRARKMLLGACGVLLLLCVLNFTETKTLCERFWAPSLDLTLTQLQSKTGDVIVGKGESVKLEIAETGKSTSAANLFIRSPGHNEVVSLPRSTNAASFVYSQDSVNDSFEYRARSGDGQTAWHRITVLERPRISQVKLRIVPPAYSHLPTQEENALPRRASALEGSLMEVSFQADQPLASMALQFGKGLSQALTESPDHSYHFRATLTNTLAFTPVFINPHRLENADKPTCEIIVYPDQPPTVTVVSPDNKVTARPDDKVKIEFEARDDIGLAKAELVATVKSETNETTTIIPIPLGNETGAKQVHKQIELDLAQFKLKQDQELSYVIRVTDTKENPAVSSPMQSEDSSTNNAANQMASAQPQNQQNPPAAKPADQKSNNSKNPSDSKAAQPTPQDDKIHLAMNQVPPKPSEQAMGSQQPQNNMSKRVLDAGQCTTCQPMRVLVDEWGKSFEGQQRDKLEIAIDPVLKSLDELLGKAQQLTDGTISAGRSAAGLSGKLRPSVDNAKDNLHQADVAVSDLKKVTHDTPYAFIGLQVHDIRETHITPARKDLGDVTLESAQAKEDLVNLDQALFQIRQAREKLANLTKTYESVKRDNKMADAMQRLAKMHQIFIEDTQALLGNKKPVLNPQDRKVAEVSDDYADKLQKLLEEQKKIMEELSKILADDPRLLRRFLALQELDGSSLRDQMTLLAKRQQVLAEQVTQWAAAAENNRQELLGQYITSQAAEQADVAERIAKLQENMLTWLPTNIVVNEPIVVERRNMAAEAARLAGDAAAHTAPATLDAGLQSAKKALEQLRQLHDSLPGLEWIPNAGDKISVYEANRMSEAADLITRQSGWIKKMETLRGGDFEHAVEVDQHRLSLDTTELGEKLDSTATSVGGLSAEIKVKATELNTTVHKEILPNETGAMDALARKSVKQASTRQTEAVTAFAKGEKQFDELLKLIIAKLDAAPPPTDPGKNKSLDDMLAMLQDEKKAAEGLGIPCRPINVSVMKDWMKASNSPNPGSGSGQAQAQMRAAQAQAKQATQRTNRNRDQSRQRALQAVAELPETHSHPSSGSGPMRPAASWNTLVSQLGDEIKQGRDNVPPEQYRQAIEQYFNTISDTTQAAPAPAAQSAH